MALPNFDIMGGFTAASGQARPSAGGFAVKQIMDRANQLMALHAQAQMQGEAEQAKMSGMARFYQTPEGQAYMNIMNQRTLSMLGGFNGGQQGSAPESSPQASVSQIVPSQAETNQGISVGAPSSPDTQAEYESGNYTPTMGIVGAQFDPTSIEKPLTFTIGETPQSKVRGQIAAERGKSQDILRQGAREFGRHTQDIQNAVSAIHTLPSIDIAGSPFNPNPPISGIRHAAGAADETFANATAAINRSITQFVKGIEGIPGARININEIRYLTDSIQQLPYLSPSGQQKRYQELNDLLRQKGVPPQYWFKIGNQQGVPTSPFEPVGRNQAAPGSRKIGRFTVEVGQ